MVVSSTGVGSDRHDAVIDIAPDAENVTLVRVPKPIHMDQWDIRGKIDGMIFTGVVDGEFRANVSIDLATGALLMRENSVPARHYIGSCKRTTQTVDRVARASFRRSS